MKNKIVHLKNGKTICRILDSIVHNGNTLYLAIELDKGAIITIHPVDIWDIVEKNSEGKFESVKDCIVESGL